MRLRKITAFAAIVVLGVSLAPVAQALPPVTWEATFGRELSDVATDADGNVYVTGFRWDRERDRSVAIVRSLAPDGSVRWRRSWVPPDVDGERTYSVGREIDVAGAVVAVGGRVAPWFCNAEGWWLRTYTTDGELLWQRQEPGWRQCNASSWVEAVSTDGGSVVLGWNELKGEPYSRGWVRTYELDGTVRWTTEFDVAAFGDVMDGVRDATITDPGTVTVVGWSRDRRDRNPDGRHHLVVQDLSSAAGTVLWTRTPGPATRGLSSADTVDGDGASLIVGATVSRRSGRVAWVASLTGNAPVDWTTEWPTTGWETSVSLTSDGTSFVTYRVPGDGDGGADAKIRELGSGGEVLSTGRLDPGSARVDMSRVAAIDGGFVVTAAVEPPVGGYVARFG